jgi:hypothetical protein
VQLPRSKETTVTDVMMNEETFEADGDGEPVLLDDAVDDTLTPHRSSRRTSQKPSPRGAHHPKCLINGGS